MTKPKRVTSKKEKPKPKESYFDALWVEKYRPRCLEDMVLGASTKQFFERVIKTRELPHLLLVGIVGTGKTSLARILIDVLDAESLVLNASDKRGIDIVRNTIKPFARSVPRTGLKIVFLDEADNLTPDSQFALRGIIEAYARTTRFILTANHAGRIIEALQSRCQSVKFEELGRKRIFKLVMSILDREGIKYEQEPVLTLVDDCYPDVRSILNQAQLMSASGAFVYQERFDYYQQLIAAVKARDFAKVRELAQGPIDCGTAIAYLVRHVDDYAKDKEAAYLIGAKWAYRDRFMIQRDIGLTAACVELFGI